MYEKRLQRIDEGRVALFELQPGELPLEAVPVNAMAGWPGSEATWNRPIPTLLHPSSVEGLDPLTQEAMELPLPSILMVTSRGIHVRPYRIYDGDTTLDTAVDRQLASTRPKKSRRSLYAGFDHVVFRQRSVPLDQIVRVVLKGGGDEFPGTFAVRVHMTESAVAGWPDWPVLDLGSQIRGRLELHGSELDLDSIEAPFSLFILEETGAANFARAFLPVLGELGVTISWDQLSSELRDVYEPMFESPNRAKKWMPLHERIHRT